MSLVLTRKAGESVVIGGNIAVRVARVRSERCKLEIFAPEDIDLWRAELCRGLPAIYAHDPKQVAELNTLLARGGFRPVEPPDKYPGFARAETTGDFALKLWQRMPRDLRELLDVQFLPLEESLCSITEVA